LLLTTCGQIAVGIGAAIADRLAFEGAKVWGLDIDTKPCCWGKWATEVLS
jgi:hypothetical protein